MTLQVEKWNVIGNLNHVSWKLVGESLKEKSILNMNRSNGGFQSKKVVVEMLCAKS